MEEVIYRVYKNCSEKYCVKKDGSSKALRVFDTKTEALAFAKKTASNQQGKVIDETSSISKVSTTISSGSKKENTKMKKKAKTQIEKIFLSLLLLIVLGIAGFFGVDYVKNNENNHTHTNAVEGTVYDDFQIHFIELGNEFAGDAAFIKAGNTDILIDAGSRTASAEVLEEYIDKYCTDGKLEYVISTHAHQDHIAGMVGNKKTSDSKNPKNKKGEEVERTGIYYYYEIGTIIDFALSDATSTLYANYLTSRDYAVSKGAKHYNAAECFNNENGAKRSYELASGITMNILYNYYYFNSAIKTGGGENNYSVCTLFTYDKEDNGTKSSHNFLLTGDLEGEGEAELAKYYNGSTSEKTLPHCNLFKAGHHGSKTSSNECLLKLITPDVCAICCCAGSTEYTANYNNIFPTQDFITRIAKYTDAVYATTMYDDKEKKFKSMNGNIIISSNGLLVAIAASNNLIKLKDTTWFNEKVYVVNNQISSGKGETDFYTAESAGAVEVPRRIWP